MTIIDDNTNTTQGQPETEKPAQEFTYEVNWEKGTLLVCLPSGLSFTMPLFSRPLAGEKQS